MYQLFLSSSYNILTTSFSDFVIRIAFVKSIHLVIIILLLKIERESWKELGFEFKNWKKQLLFGFGGGLSMFLLISVGLNTVLNNIFPKPSGSGSILSYFTEIQNLYIWLVIGILGGGFVEELVRIFILTRFQKKFHCYGLYFALICSSLLFGIGHIYQGAGAAISTGISGLTLGIIYIIRKSALEVIAIHAFTDVFAILAAYQLANLH
jgi:membrane protease YdiL (CAAX protease family)